MGVLDDSTVSGDTAGCAGGGGSMDSIIPWNWLYVKGARPPFISIILVSWGYRNVLLNYVVLYSFDNIICYNYNYVSNLYNV